MKFVALKDLPQGQKPGEIFDTSEAMGDVLIAHGGARKATDDDLVLAGQDPAPAAEAKSQAPRRRYNRRDLAATDPDTK